MPFKHDYLAAEHITADTYANRHSALARIRVLYNSAGIVVRQGVRLSDEAAGELWKRFFGPLREHFAQLPHTRAEYDAYLLQQISVLARLLRELELLQNERLGGFGIAQKMLNLFMKDHWALDAFPKQTQLLLHLPLDLRVLSKLKRRPSTWHAWTRATDTPDHRRDYQRIQDRFRSEWKRTRIFRSPIEMEQWIWYRIRNT
jgi:hypothetical protein